VSVIKPKVAKATGLSDGGKIPGVGKIPKVDKGVGSIPNVVKTTGSNLVTVGIGSAQVDKSTGLAGVEFVDRSMSLSPQMAMPISYRLVLRDQFRLRLGSFGC
jgi:hypothetical protein